MNDYDKDNISAILQGHGDWFTAQLMRLIAKADNYNRKRLFKAFPDVVTAVETHLGYALTSDLDRE